MEKGVSKQLCPNNSVDAYCLHSGRCRAGLSRDLRLRRLLFTQYLLTKVNGEFHTAVDAAGMANIVACINAIVVRRSPSSAIASPVQTVTVRPVLIT